MSNIAKVRILIATIRDIAIYLTDDEITEIGLVLLKATNRLEKESRNEDIKKRVAEATKIKIR